MESKRPEGTTRDCRGKQRNARESKAKQGKARERKKFVRSKQTSRNNKGKKLRQSFHWINPNQSQNKTTKPTYLFNRCSLTVPRVLGQGICFWRFAFVGLIEPRACFGLWFGWSSGCVFTHRNPTSHSSVRSKFEMNCLSTVC